MTGDRWRLHTRQDGSEHVSSVVLSDQEAREHLALETQLHLWSGWHVDRVVPGSRQVTFRRRGTVRTVHAVRYDALSDS